MALVGSNVGFGAVFRCFSHRPSVLFVQFYLLSVVVRTLQLTKSVIV